MSGRYVHKSFLPAEAFFAMHNYFEFHQAFLTGHKFANSKMPKLRIPLKLKQGISVKLMPAFLIDLWPETGFYVRATQGAVHALSTGCRKTVDSGSSYTIGNWSKPAAGKIIG